MNGSASSDEVRYQRGSDVAEQELGGELVLLRLTTGAVLRVNPSGSVLWAALATPSTVQELADRLVGRFGIADQVAMRDVEVFLAPLLNVGIVVAMAR